MSFPARALPILLIVAVGSCSPAVNVGSPTPDATFTYLVRLGTDTVAVEQYRRTGNHIESDILQRSPVTYVGHSVIDLGANGLASTWTYDPRLVSGARPTGAATRSVTFGSDSVTVVSDTGAQFRRRVAGGPGIPNLGNSMLAWELAVAYARAQGRDSVDVPMVGVTGGRGTLPIRFLTRDSVRSYFGGPMYPVYIKLDPEGHIAWFNGTATTIKTMATRVNQVDVRSVASSFTVRDQTGGAMGAASTRDTVRVQISGAQFWIDYGRPALRGRNPWVNGVLGDTLWRTGANAATQFKTDADLRINGQTVPAGMYTLWTHTFPGNSGYELAINKQVGQWGAGARVYDPKNDLVRVPLAMKRVPTAAERFTMMIEPGGDGGVLAMQWGTTRLETPFTIVKK